MTVMAYRRSNVKEKFEHAAAHASRVAGGQRVAPQDIAAKLLPKRATAG
jgi:hypothetical protein